MNSCYSGRLRPNQVALANPHALAIIHAGVTIFQPRQLNVRASANAPSNIEFN